jgi:hypothetical protein
MLWPVPVGLQRRHHRATPWRAIAAAAADASPLRETIGPGAEPRCTLPAAGGTSEAGASHVGP